MQRYQARRRRATCSSHSDGAPYKHRYEISPEQITIGVGRRQAGRSALRSRGGTTGPEIRSPPCPRQRLQGPDTSSISASETSDAA